MLKGALAAAVTPLRDGGEALDEDAFAPYVEYLAGGGLDGILALGTTGEGILLREDERRRAAGLFVAAAAGRVRRRGALRRADDGRDRRRSRTCGRDRRGRGRGHRAAVLRARRTRADVAHFAAAAEACAPLPFYLYEFRGSGRVLDSARGDRAGCASWRRTSPASRSRTSRSRTWSRTSSRGSTSSSARSRWSCMAWSAGRPGPFPGSLRCSPELWRSSSASVRATSAACGKGSSGSRSRPRRSSASADSASRFARTFGDRFARSCPTSRRQLDAWLESS